MTTRGWYERIRETQDSEIQDMVKMDIQADSDEDHLKCLNHMMIFHEILEEYDVFKNDSS